MEFLHAGQFNVNTSIGQDTEQTAAMALKREARWHRRACWLNWLCVASVLWTCAFAYTGSAYIAFEWTRPTGLLLIYTSFVLPLVAMAFGIFVWVTRPSGKAVNARRTQAPLQRKEPA